MTTLCQMMANQLSSARETTHGVISILATDRTAFSTVEMLLVLVILGALTEVLVSWMKMVN